MVAAQHPNRRAVDADNELSRLVDEISERLRAGEPVDLDQYAAAGSRQRQQLEQVLPTLRALASLAAAAPRDDAVSAPAGFEIPPSGVLGDFRILREIGRGGMGVVYEAEQLSLSRRVALKVLPFAAVLDEQKIKRFKNEALAAAQLEHPNIVDVYGVGCERSVHYYAMRMVDGQSLAGLIGKLKEERSTRADSVRGSDAAAHELRTKPAVSDTRPAEAFSTLQSLSKRDYYRAVARIGADVADALDHAHQSGVIHRDIKPSNLILDAAGKVWVADFGLARVDSAAALTMTGDLLGTLRYMSPEQALGERPVADHRHDVYALGVTLYELLTLQPAHDADNRAELLRQIMVDEPRRPRKIDAAIPAELETIVLTAMAKSPEARYATAQELCSDLRRFLSDRPIQARPPGVVQRMRKWSRRHRAILNAVFVLTVVALVGAVCAAGLIWRKQQQTAEALKFARQQQQIAEQKRAEAEAVQRFLVDDLLTASAPERAQGREATVREILQRAELRVEGAFRDQPLPEAAVRHALGTAYYALSDLQGAKRHLTRAAALRREHLGSEDLDTLDTLNALGAVYSERREWSRAEEIFRSSWSIRRRKLGESHPRTLESMANLAASLSAGGDSGRALALYERALALHRANGGDESREAQTVISNIANNLYNNGQLQAAADLFEQSLAAQKRKLGQLDPLTLETQRKYALVVRDLGRYDEALRLAQEVVPVQRRVLGEKHADAMKGEYLVATIQNEAGDRQQAVRSLQDLLARQRELLGADDADTLDTMTMLASILRIQGEFAEAEPLLVEALAARRRLLGPDDPKTLASLSALGAVLRGENKYAEANDCHQQVLEGFLKRYGATHPETLGAMTNYSNTLRDLGRLEESQTIGEQALCSLRQTVGEDHPLALMTAHNLAYSYEATGDLAKALKMRVETFCQQRAAQGDDHPHTVRFRQALQKLLVKSEE